MRAGQNDKSVVCADGTTMRVRKIPGGGRGCWRVAENGKLIDVFSQKRAAVAKFDAMVERHGGKITKREAAERKAQ